MLVELLTLQNAGRSLEEICHPRTEGNNWAHTQNTTITISEDGAATLQFADVQAEQAILQAIPESASSEQRTDRQADSEAIMEEVMDIVAEGRFAGNGGDRSLLPPSWMDVSLKDPQLKIAVCLSFDRLMQSILLTNTDHQTHSAAHRQACPRPIHIHLFNPRRSLQRIQGQREAEEARADASDAKA